MPIDMETFENANRKEDAKTEIKSFLNGNPSRFSEIVENTDRSKSTVSKYLKQLKEIEVVRKDDENLYHLLNELKGDEDRILEAIVEEQISDQEALKENLKLSVNLETKLKKLEELKYISLGETAIAVSDKALSRFDRKITGEKVDNQMVVKTYKTDGFSTYTAIKDPVLDSPKEFLQYFPELPDDVEICDHCGLPLSPYYIEKIASKNPDDIEKEMPEKERRRLEEELGKLYGPVGSIYNRYRTYHETDTDMETTDPHFVTYRKDGKEYHPHCRKLIEQL
jgi:DNA-binding transcriptional ArsR family regulator